MANYSAGEVFVSFVAAINAHDFASLSRLMTDDHVLVDALGKRLHGRETMLSAWEGFFQSFPGYHVEVGDLFTKRDSVAAFGEASGRWRVDGRDLAKREWRVPAAWRAVIDGDRVAEWRVFCDTAWAFPPL